MQRMTLLCCLVMMIMNTGCVRADDSNAEAYPETISTADGAALTEMLLKTDSAVRIRVNDAESYDPDAWIQEAVQSHILARTMLQRVTWYRSGEYLTVQAYYAKPQDTLRQDKQKLHEAAKLWCLENAAESDAVRVLLAHDLLCRSCTYANDLPDCHGAAGALLERRAACDGYAEAFALLMEYAGISVKIVTGQAVDEHGKREAHAWNLIQLNGAWYHIDCTWDDSGAAPEHTYFLCDDHTMRLTHIWDDEKYPPAIGGGYRYEVIVSEMAARIRKADVGYTGYNPVQDSDW